jgi:FAD/FMN-containing dehydrogenase
MDLSAESDEDFEYTVAWVDCLASGKELGRGIFMRGNHDREPGRGTAHVHKELPLAVPIDFPAFALNALTMKAFNTAYYHAQREKHVQRTVAYAPFFYPLDAIHDWNRIYGKRGFLQYQCVVPHEDGYDVMLDILRRISRSGEGSFLTVLKKFGDVPSPGMLSFPRPGLTVALDFPYNGRKTLRLFEELDGVVRRSGGAVYPAKDARMSAESFQTYFPQWERFARYIDPKFSSSFWRRVTQQQGVPIPVAKHK